ncbi:MAG: hypothetical protein SFY67_14165 [Candidatus Melainabacteria bacterium]|nr:hypothetical protein [Candidatus Melainabacteria bacterium]
MTQVKRTRRQKDQVLLTSLLALCLGYTFAQEAKASDCDEFDIDIDAACQSMSVSYSPACDTSYISTSAGSGSYCPSSNYGPNYGSSYNSGYNSGCNTSYSSSCNSNYNSNYGNGASQQNFGRSPIVGNLNNVQNYSTYNSLYNSGYGQNTNMGRAGGYRDGASGESAEFMRTIRTPLIQGAPNGAPNQCPAQGQAPATGDGSRPAGVTYGQGYYNPEYPATHVNNVPLTMGGIEGKYMVNSAVQPYLRPPTQNNGCDPGMLDTPPDFYQAPATVTNICPQGGIQGQAPTNRWGGQTTRDYGTGIRCKKETSSTNDFGQRLQDKPDLYATPQCAQDGPRTDYCATDNSSLRRGPNRPNAQTTTDRQGNRTFFKGPNYRSQSTLANY